MATFSVNQGMGQGDIMGAINYLLANIGQGLQVNGGTGQVVIPNSPPNTVPYAYAYPYLYIAFANSFDGVVDFSQTDYVNKTYIGFWNTNVLTPGGSDKPIQYIWYKLADGGFGSTKYLWYNVPSVNQVYFSVSEFSPAVTSAEEYLWRQYDPLLVPASGVNLTVLTNASNLISGTLASNGSIYVQNEVSGGGIWVPAGSVTVGISDSVLVVPVINNSNYNLGLVFSGASADAISEDSQLTYDTFSTSTNNKLTAPNIQSTTITLPPQGVAPTSYSTGTMAMADAVNWDPAGYSSTTPYLALYNGTTWVALG
jgi:hypothetical protein